MRFSPSAFAKAALVMATLASTPSAAAERIVILNAATQPRAVTPASGCAAAPADAGGDIECVIRLAPPQPGAESAAPRRIVIRAQWAPQQCATRAAQVVDLTRATARARALPIVDQAGPGRPCAS